MTLPSLNTLYYSQLQLEHTWKKNIGQVHHAIPTFTVTLAGESESRNYTIGREIPEVPIVTLHHVSCKAESKRRRTTEIFGKKLHLITAQLATNKCNKALNSAWWTVASLHVLHSFSKLRWKCYTPGTRASRNLMPWHLTLLLWMLNAT